MNRFVVLIFSMGLVLCLGIWWLVREDNKIHTGEELEIQCAAGLRLPVEEIAANFEKEFGVKVRLSYGGSGELLGKLSITGGDLYIPADASYAEEARVRHLVTTVIPFSSLTAGIIVKEGNPEGIKKLDDLTKKDVRVVIAEKSAAIGRLTHEVLGEKKVLDQIREGDFSTTSTVNAVANAVKLNSADAGIIWDSLMAQYPQHQFIEIPEFNLKKKISVIGVMRNSKHQVLALQFAHYLSSEKKGKSVFRKHGFNTVIDEGKLNPVDD